jgi:hypothetical protein
MTEMTWALAARMTVWTILILIGMTGAAVLIGKALNRISYDYPEPTESEDQDYEEGTTPPRAA